MTEGHIPPLRHVSPMATVQRERKLPGTATLTVRIREHIQATDVVAEVQPPTRHYFLDIAGGLGIPDTEVARVLQVDVGGQVEEGEILAGPVGIGRRMMRAPADGQLISLSRGRLLFEVFEAPVMAMAGLPGDVVASDGLNTLVIETTGALIQGAWGNGRRGWGVIRMAADSPDEALHPDKLDVDIRGAMLIAGVCSDPAALQEATDLSIRGLLLGSLSAELLPQAAQAPYPILLTEGFGSIGINRPSFELLKSNAGREVSLEARLRQPYEGQLPEAIIPLPSSQRMSPLEALMELAAGTRVRVLREPHAGAVGTLRGILPHIERYPSGILARSGTVDIEGVGPTSVPLANLEILP